MNTERITTVPDALRWVLAKDANYHPDIQLTPDARVEIAELAESLQSRNERRRQ